ncbi:hypothetical protein E2C01_078933 [Portunus trituberculatus]|uniref:Uncharacterized protein n=1 Tax=Portunus trituberculatus TaxID=210409 RepID=A0A5B7IVG5_PORTR|nr:hypothetical protein [Portunus trituberculatus]
MMNRQRELSGDQQGSKIHLSQVLKSLPLRSFLNYDQLYTREEGVSGGGGGRNTLLIYMEI